MHVFFCKVNNTWDMVQTKTLGSYLKQTDERTDGRTGDGEFNSPPSSLHEAGDKNMWKTKTWGGGLICLRLVLHLRVGQ